MLLLAFDTTAAACSVAIVRGGKALARLREIMAQGQAEALLPLIERAMAEAGVAYSALERIAVTIGPGSFTGVRVGLSAGRALGLAAGKPVVGVSTLEVLAATVPPQDRGRATEIVAAIDTGRGDLYLQRFEAQRSLPLSEPVALPVAEVAAWAGDAAAVLIGDAAGRVRELLARAFVSAADPLPDAVVLAGIAATRPPADGGPLPLYVLPPRITLAPHGGRLRP